jgi:hypothetical protein
VSDGKVNQGNQSDANPAVLAVSVRLGVPGIDKSAGNEAAGNCPFGAWG